MGFSHLRDDCQDLCRNDSDKRIGTHRFFNVLLLQKLVRYDDGGNLNFSCTYEVLVGVLETIRGRSIAAWR